MKHCFSRMMAMARDKRGGVALMFGILLLPTLMVVGLAVDYSFYVQAQSQLNLGADAAALHAVRAASSAFSSSGNATTALQAGDKAGRDWFASQVGLLTTASAQISTLPIVTYTQSPPGFSGAVSYSGTVASHLGAVFGFLNYPIAGNASAVISDYYVEVLMLLDNSSSMAIGATTADIAALEQATMCSSQYTNNDNQGMSAYSWTYTNGYDYTAIGKAPPVTPVSGKCDPAYTGASSICFYPPAVLGSQVDKNGQCTNGGGKSSNAGAHTPQAPCAFACHSSSGNDDYYALAQSLKVKNPNFNLRMDVVHQAAANVISTLKSSQQSPGQFSVGVYSFTSIYCQVYPTVSPTPACATPSSEAGINLDTALAATQAMTVPISTNTPNTNFTSSATSLAVIIKNAGDGTSSTAPRKNLFIVTDGMQDATIGGTRVQGQMTSSTNEQTCKLFKDKGINVYVLYTPYLPLPNPYYLTNVKSLSEPAATSVIVKALQACASTPANFFQASDPAAINTAMQQMLQSALNAPARVAQ